MTTLSSSSVSPVLDQGTSLVVAYFMIRLPLLEPRQLVLLLFLADVRGIEACDKPFTALNFHRRKKQPDAGPYVNINEYLKAIASLDREYVRTLRKRLIAHFGAPRVRRLDKVVRTYGDLQTQTMASLAGVLYRQVFDAELPADLAVVLELAP